MREYGRSASSARARRLSVAPQAPGPVRLRAGPRRAFDLEMDCMAREKGYCLGDGCYTMLACSHLTQDWRQARKFCDDFLRTKNVDRGLPDGRAAAAAVRRRRPQHDRRDENFVATKPLLRAILSGDEGPHSIFSSRAATTSTVCRPRQVSGRRFRTSSTGI